MQKAHYRVLAGCGSPCPTVLEKEDSDEIVVIGTLLSPEEEKTMIKSANVGVASHEKTVRIPRAVFERAVDKILTEKASAR